MSIIAKCFASDTEQSAQKRVFDMVIAKKALGGTPYPPEPPQPLNNACFFPVV